MGKRGLALAAALALGAAGLSACNRGGGREETENVTIAAPPMNTVVEETPAAAPAPRNTTAEVPASATAPSQQIDEDAAATGMTARSGAGPTYQSSTTTTTSTTTSSSSTSDNMHNN